MGQCPWRRSDRRSARRCREEAKVDIDIRPFLEGGPLGLVGMVLAWLLYRIEGKLERFARSNEELIRSVRELLEEDKARRRVGPAG